MGFKRKFEIGDKVRVIKPNDPYYKQIGKIINYYSPYDSKGFYNVKFGNESRNYYSNSLEKVEDSSSTNTKSNKLSISDFKVGMKVRVKENFDKIITDPDYSSNISSKMKSFKGKELIVEGIGIDFIIAKSYYWLPEWLEIVDGSTNSLNLVKESSVKEVGIVTKVNFTLTDFKPEELKHSKFTVL